MKIKKIMAGMLAMVTVMGSLMSPLSAKADQIDAPYLALGADLNETEKSTVQSLLEINEADLSSYQVITVTNADEHKYLDSYLDSSVIGTRALSSVLIEKKDKGNGIKVTTSNITYCTTVCIRMRWQLQASPMRMYVWLDRLISPEQRRW